MKPFFLLETAGKGVQTRCKPSSKEESLGVCGSAPKRQFAARRLWKLPKCLQLDGWGWKTCLGVHFGDGFWFSWHVGIWMDVVTWAPGRRFQSPWFQCWSNQVRQRGLFYKHLQAHRICFSLNPRLCGTLGPNSPRGLIIRGGRKRWRRNKNTQRRFLHFSFL